MFKDRTDAAVNFCEYPTRITGSRCETVLDRISVSAMLDASLFTQFYQQNGVTFCSHVLLVTCKKLCCTVLAKLANVYVIVSCINIDIGLSYACLD